MTCIRTIGLAGLVFATASTASTVTAQAQTSRAQLDGLIASHASANGIPAAVVHRVIVRESRYRPRAIGRGGAMGLMQIKHATARGLGYRGTAAGLLDADTNLTYAVKYLAGAYRLAGGNTARAWAYYRSGYYYAAKRQRANVDSLSRRDLIARKARAPEMRAVYAQHY